MRNPTRKTIGGAFLKKIISIISAILFVFGGLTIQTKAAQMTDLEPEYIFYEEILFLTDAGVIAGYPDGTFRPNEKVTRAQAAMMIGRALNLDGTKRPDSIFRCQ